MTHTFKAVRVSDIRYLKCAFYLREHFTSCYELFSNSEFCSFHSLNIAKELSQFSSDFTNKFWTQTSSRKISFLIFSFLVFSLILLKILHTFPGCDFVSVCKSSSFDVKCSNWFEICFLVCYFVTTLIHLHILLHQCL
jgi:hypothetical protein